MKKSLLLGAFLAAGSMGLADLSFGHGGTYRGPGDTVPPGGAAPGPGGAAPPPAGPSGPSSPGPTTPGTPAPVTPGQTPSTPTPTAPVSQQGGDTGPDLSIWDFWWGFNKEPYLNLRNKVRSIGVQSGSDEEFLGLGEQKKTADSLRPGEELIRATVVPALKKALETEEQNDIVTGCLIALAKIGDVKNEDGTSEFVDIIQSFLAAEEQEISETAALALGILADDRSVPGLVGLMLDNDVGRTLIGNGRSVPFRTQSFAAYGLGLVGYRTETNEMRQTIVEHIIDFVEQGSFAQPDQQVGALQALGLIPLDWDGTSEAAQEASGNGAIAANRIAVLDYLIGKLNPDANRGGFADYRVRAQVPIAIARLLATHEETFPVENAGAVEVRTRCIEALLKVVGKNAKEKRVEVLQSGVIALGMIGNAADGKDAFTKDNAQIFKDLQRIGKTAADNQTEFFALMAMAQMGSRPGPGDNPRGFQPKIQKELLGALAKGKGQKRPWAALSLGVFGNALNENDGVLEPAVTLALRDLAKKGKSPVEYGAFAIALGLLKDQSSSTILVEKLDKMGTGQEEVRGNICVGLGLMEASEAQEILNQTVTESKFRPAVLKQAAIGLGLLGDKSAVGLLLTMLEDAKGLSSQAAIASALGTIGDVSAVDGLVKMLAGETEKKMTDTARGFAAVALGITCDKEDFPWNTKIAVNANYRANIQTLTDAETGNGILDIL